MDTCLQCPTSVTSELSYDSLWFTLYSLLLPLVKRWVYASNVSSWNGQETDIAWDIVLTAIKRTFEYVLKAQREGTNIASLERLSLVIAKNYYQDLRRKDYRLLHFDRDGYLQESRSVIHHETDFSEAVLDKVYEEWLFNELAKEIAKFPRKMRTALLIDLARRMEFDEVNSNPTPLQQAFLEVGIRLQEYQFLLPIDPIGRARHSSLVSLGYKRIATLFSVQKLTEILS
jgi:hypothetical protein